MGFVGYPIGADGTTPRAGVHGLVLITSANFTAATTVSVDRCFLPVFENYRIAVRSTASTTASIAIRLRVNGADSSASYVGARYNIKPDGTLAGQVLTADTTQWTPHGAVGTSGTFAFFADIMSPYLSTETNISVPLNMTNYTDPSRYAYSMAGIHTVTTSYDGLTLIPSAGNITGTVSIWGFMKP